MNVYDDDGNVVERVAWPEPRRDNGGTKALVVVGLLALLGLILAASPGSGKGSGAPSEVPATYTGPLVLVVDATGYRVEAIDRKTVIAKLGGLDVSAADVASKLGAPRELIVDVKNGPAKYVIPLLAQLTSDGWTVSVDYG
jgi:hypothetical protein